MSNVHLWQYIVIAGPAAVLGGLAVWAFNRWSQRVEAPVVTPADDDMLSWSGDGGIRRETR